MKGRQDKLGGTNCMCLCFVFWKHPICAPTILPLFDDWLKKRKKSVSTGHQSQTGKCDTVPLLSSTDFIPHFFFCCDVIPFTFHFTQWEDAYAIFMRSWALLHGLFLDTINQCTSLHCRRVFSSLKSMNGAGCIRM